MLSPIKNCIKEVYESDPIRRIHLGLQNTATYTYYLKLGINIKKLYLDKSKSNIENEITRQEHSVRLPRNIL